MTVPETYPITGMCVVADPAKCPPGYDLLMYSEDKKDDCDMWKDGFFKSRVTRYLCITRLFPLDGGRLNNVLGDIVIQNEKELPPQGYTLIENTVDTSEKATRKKQICVRMIPRISAKQAITKLILLSKNKRAPAEFTMAGEINGLLVCFKYGDVPPSKLSPTSSQPVTPVNAPINLVNNYFDRPREPLPVSQSAPQKSTNHLSTHPLSGVPFQINPRYTRGSHSSAASVAAGINYRSYVDIENEFKYSFRLERTTVGSAS